VSSALTTTTPKVTPLCGTKMAILSYIAREDSSVYVFNNEKLFSLIGKSAELRAALRRAMIADVVGKVVYLYLSKVDANKSFWQRWIEDV